ncbi:ribonuclease pancreatic-like [Pangshura tecta]
MLRMLLLLLLPLAILLPPEATAETQDGMDGGVLIPEDFMLPAAHSDSGHIVPLLSAHKANRRDRSRPQIQVRPKSHHQVNPVTDTDMAPRGPRPALLLPLALLSGSLGLTGECDKYEQFKKRHFDYPKTSDIHNETYCNYMMKKRNMTCKPKNTFIHAPEEDIKAICEKKGIPVKDNIYKSNTTFNLTICKRKTQNGKACTYEEEEQTSIISVACNEQHLPVHFENMTPAASMSLERIQTQLGRTSTGLPRTHMERL